MLKVLSTKLAVDEADRFNAAAKQQGLSKAGLLKRLVKEYLSDTNKKSATSDSSKPGYCSSFEKRQTPEKCNRRSPLLDKQKVLRNRELERCSSHMRQPCRIPNCTQRISTDRTPACISSTAIDSRTIASLAKIPDSREIVIYKPFVEQGLLNTKIKTQARSKAESWKFLLLIDIFTAIIWAVGTSTNKMSGGEVTFIGKRGSNASTLVQPGAKELKQSVERFQALIEEIPTGVINVDTKGKITYVNKDVLRHTGYSREELVGKNAFRFSLISPETLKLL